MNTKLTFVRMEEQNNFLLLQDDKKYNNIIKKKRNNSKWQKRYRLEEQMALNQRERDMDRMKIIHEV